jgi:5-formyltetrahydrofolate cyclo-ligase
MSGNAAAGTSGQAQADDAAIRQAKRLLRNAVLLRRESRSPQARAADDHARFDRIREALAQVPRGVHTVAAYLSGGTEPGTLELVGWLAAQEVTVLLPSMSGQPAPLLAPDWAPYAGPDRLRSGPYSIPEPTTPPLGADAVVSAQVVICPGLAANREGDRLGRGGGWYDRALAGLPEGRQVWLLLNDDEILDTIPTDPWDRRVGAIITATRMIRSAAG